MSTRYTDEEKALLPAYHDEEFEDSTQPPPPPFPGDESARRKDCRKRKFRALFRHLVIFSLLFLGWKTYSAYRDGRLGCGGHRAKTNNSDMWRFEGLAGDDPSQGFPWPPQVTLEECVEWPNPGPPEHDEDRGHDHPRHPPPHHPPPPHHDHLPHSFESSFKLPPAADILAFFAKGPWSVGSFTVEHGTQTAEEIVVDVTTKWRGPPGILHHTQLCKFTGENGLIGVGVVSVKGHHGHRNDHHRVAFDINVRLPAASDKPLGIKKFLTYLPIFTQKVADLGNSVEFNDFSLKGSVSSITVDSVSARRSYINAGVGHIKGHFATSSSLELVTSSGKIDAAVDLINDETGDEWTKLVLSTSAGAIKANLSLQTKSDTNVGGKFNITSGASTGHIVLNTVTAPKDSTVDLTAHGSVGAIDVTLHPTFEGHFDLASSVFSTPTVQERKEKDEDGRERKFEYGQVGKGIVQGDVWWDAGDGNTDGKERGSVDLKNSLGKVVLKV